MTQPFATPPAPTLPEAKAAPRFMTRMRLAFGRLLVDQEVYTDEEVAFQKEWIFKNVKEVNLNIGVSSIIFTAISILLGYLGFHGDFQKILCGSFTGAGFLMMIGVGLARRGWFFPRSLHLATMIVMVGALALGAARAIAQDDPELPAILATLLTVVLGFVRLAPPASFPYILATSFALNLSLCSAALLFTQGGRQFLEVLTISLMVAVTNEGSRLRQKKREAVLELRTRQLIARIERTRLDQEIALAQEIQESFSAPGVLVQSGPFLATFYQRRAEALAGDWATINCLPDGRLAILAADATGKGIQAALVIHAIQSLWASALLDPVFDARTWLERVNQSLRLLGSRRPQCATLGLALISPNEVTYWSAGHLPLFLVIAAGEHEEQVEAISGRGNLLGAGTALDLMPRTRALTMKESYRILLATDGLLPRGTRSSRAEIAKLANAHRHDQAPHLSPAALHVDDMTMVVVTHGQVA